MKKILSMIPSGTDPQELNGVGLLIALSKSHGEQVRACETKKVNPFPVMKSRADYRKQREKDEMSDIIVSMHERLKNANVSFEVLYQNGGVSTIVIDGFTYDLNITAVENE